MNSLMNLPSFLLSSNLIWATALNQILLYMNCCYHDEHFVIVISNSSYYVVSGCSIKVCVINITGLDNFGCSERLLGLESMNIV